MISLENAAGKAGGKQGGQLCPGSPCMDAAGPQDLLWIILWLVPPQESKPRMTKILRMGEVGMRGTPNWTSLARMSTPLHPGSGERKYLASLVAVVGNEALPSPKWKSVQVPGGEDNDNHPLLHLSVFFGGLSRF